MGAPSQMDMGGSSVIAEDLHQKDNIDDNDKTARLEATYTSLIQQYLSVLCIDNATFLAERLVALTKNPHSLYLLAICHYRGGSPRRAQTVLEESPTNTSAMRYLLAKCHYELEHYGLSEEVLLEECRSQYYHISRNPTTTTTTEGEDGVTAAAVVPPTSMDEWILSTTPCPIPNGAAGLYLLGNICRKSNRKQRAMDYYRMSLKLDPFLWTSYEALCEMGDSSSDDDNNEIDDPTVIFGVFPQALTCNENHDPQQTNLADELSTPGFSFSAHQTPGTTTNTALQPMELGTPSTGGSSYLPKASLFHTGGDGRHKATSTTKRSSARPSNSASSSLFETPNLTPILRNDKSFLGHHHHHGDKSVLDDQTTSIMEETEDEQQLQQDSTNYNPVVVHRRAHHVAARLYYEPSPETTPPPPRRSTGTTTSRYFLRGLQPSGGSHMSDMAQSRLCFSSDSLPPAAAVTPARLKNAAAATTTESSLLRSSSQQLPRQPQPSRPLFWSSNHQTTTPNVMEQDETDNGGDTKVLADAPMEEPVAAVKDGGGTDKDTGVQEILELLCVLGAAHRQLCQYRCREALQLFHRLPQEQFHTGWVLHQVGRAYFEMADYQNAQRSLELMQQMEPHRMKGLEVLSTALWHLKKEVELAHLAQRAVDFDRLSPESWCVVGNCFSLQKEHETALGFFRRSIQLDPTFTYSHTLSGHEYVANEDFDKAVACYRDAIRADERHYNAWYGLGAIYYRQEKYDLAEYHFKRALAINRQSSVLHCHLGMAQHANGKAYEALDTLAGAFRLDPRNPQARYQRATIYMALDRPHEALAELKKVRDAAPREASVHFAMGRVLKRIGRPEQAMRCFLTALDLDPKDNNLIKAAMDKMDEPDVDEVESAF